MNVHVYMNAHTYVNVWMNTHMYIPTIVVMVVRKMI